MKIAVEGEHTAGAIVGREKVISWWGLVKRWAVSDRQA